MSRIRIEWEWGEDEEGKLGGTGKRARLNRGVEHLGRKRTWGSQERKEQRRKKQRRIREVSGSDFV